MVQETVKDALLAIDESELSRLARVANRLLAGRAIFTESGWRHRYRSGSGSDFLDYREYVPGDDLRMVDWRASARSADLLVRRFFDETSSQWYVCLDRSASMGIQGGEKWLLAVRLAAAFIYILLHRTNRTGLLTFSSEIDARCLAGRGRGQFERALSVLSETVPCQMGGASRLQACAPNLGRKISVIVISDFLASDHMREGLDSLRHLGGQVHALQVLSKREIELGLTGRMLLRDVESGQELMVDGDLDDPRTGADDRMKQLQSGLADYCRKNDVALTLCQTGQHWKTIVVDHLVKACKRHA